MTTLLAGLEVTPSASITPDRLKLLIHGQSGSGKTTLASSIAMLGKTLLVDMNGEKGIASLRGAPWEANVDIIRPTSITQIDDLCNELAKGQHGYEAVVLDSLSALQVTTMRYLLGHDENAIAEITKGKQGAASMQTWGSIQRIITDVMTFWMALADGTRAKPMHVVMTSQSKSREDDEGNERLYPDVSAGSRSIVMASPDFVGYADIEEYPAEDGSGMKERHILRLGYHPK